MILKSSRNDRSPRHIGLPLAPQLVLPLGPLDLVTGANGTGKSSLYRALRLLADASLNSVVASLAREGGLPSTLWAGPEIIGRAVKRGDYAVEPTAPKKKAHQPQAGIRRRPLQLFHRS